MDDVSKGPWLDDGEQKAWRSYLLMQRTLETHLERHLQRDFGLSKSDFEILVNLSESEHGRMRAFELGRATQWEKSRLSHHLSRMEKRGLIRKEACESRYPEIVVTAAGLKAIQECAPAHAARVREFIVDVFGPERFAMLGEAADEVVEAVGKHCATDCALES
ncbi:MarR family winged helix-turn-helix transcriptional regulator [Kribbella sp.]|uniref:MarR family winged helix-turn-helix transcriptional regulator n=1 Tax=Kribbella sp. TaxID=1871183 RepID=UPI002D4FA0F4|nr:MarR family winged helix-turn-helix transcriptional regulator [Kribbella sp.]HZX08266.1 MarR family winged helix-turn-helix transcriptional regulator [Kribbella sp.]